MDDDELDPRIQVELEKLNTATDEINKLEIELDEANTTFRMLLNECTRRLKVHSTKFGSAIVSARPYYEALDVARVAQQECQRAAVGFQRANEVHEAAKETVALAETRFMSQQPEWRFDSAWQEMLNHATLKVCDAEKQRAESAAYHGQATAHYKQAQDKVHQLETRLHRNVAKSRPYFEEKARCNDQLAAQKCVVEALQKHVSKVKTEYADSLRRLEAISEEIHSKRASMMEACRGVREPGVGAELVYEDELADLRLALDTHRTSRSPDGGAKSALVSAHHHSGDRNCVSLEVNEHFADVEASLEGLSGSDNEAGPNSPSASTVQTRCDVQVPDSFEGAARSTTKTELREEEEGREMKAEVNDAESRELKTELKEKEGREIKAEVNEDEESKELSTILKEKENLSREWKKEVEAEGTESLVLKVDIVHVDDERDIALNDGEEKSPVISQGAVDVVHLVDSSAVIETSNPDPGVEGLPVAEQSVSGSTTRNVAAMPSPDDNVNQSSIDSRPLALDEGNQDSQHVNLITKHDTESIDVQRETNTSTDAAGRNISNTTEH